MGQYRGRAVRGRVSSSISGPYTPNTTASAPPDTPGSTAPAPISAPHKRCRPHQALRFRRSMDAPPFLREFFGVHHTSFALGPQSHTDAQL